MKTIQDHIKKNQFERIYVLYGQEDYLKHQYRDLLTEALCPGGDAMNIGRFEGAKTSVDEVLALADTLPFFAERRVIILENTGWLKKTQEAFLDALPSIPDTTYFIFLEQETDKRSKGYKKLASIGYATEMNTPKAKDLLVFIQSRVKKENKQITQEALEYLVEHAGQNMHHLLTELEKLISYGYDAEVLTLPMLMEVCSGQAENKVFDMMDAIGNQKRDEALRYYRDLVELRESGFRILALLVRHVNILLQMEPLVASGVDSKSIASNVGIPPFTVSKYKAQLKQFTYTRLLHMLDACADTDYRIKQGLITERIGVEVLIIEFSSYTD